MAKVLVVDDDYEFRTNLCSIVAGAGYEVTMAATGREAIEKATDVDFDLILLDLIMPKMSGTDVLGELRRVSPRSRITMISAFATIDSVVEAMKRGASDYVAKPFNVDDLLMRIRRTLEEARIDTGMEKAKFDNMLNSLANPTRRAIMLLLSQRGDMRLMEIVRELGFDDHTKVIFHLKILKQSMLIEPDGSKSYSLTNDGVRALDSYQVIEKYLQ